MVTLVITGAAKSNRRTFGGVGPEGRSPGEECCMAAGRRNSPECQCRPPPAGEKNSLAVATEVGVIHLSMALKQKSRSSASHLDQVEFTLVLEDQQLGVRRPTRGGVV